VIWVGSDDGLVHLSKDEGKNWKEVSPPLKEESLINAIEVSPHRPGMVYLAVTRYKFDDLSPMIYVSENYGESWELRVNGLPEDHFVRVLREDPVQAGLLYAGTENGIYISFNYGERWVAFQSNLPLSPVTDLIIKDNDLIAATSGRAFWILDDLSSLQQSKGSADTASVQLFAPKTTYKYTLGGGFEKGGNRGQNPWPGVSIDYYLPHNFSDTSLLTLEILNEKQQVIRSYSNQKPVDFKSWTGGPPPPKVIPAKAGLNRTNWDLGRESLPGVEGVFVLGSLAGSTVGPGEYSLRLSTGDLVDSSKVQLLADPRLEATAEDFKLQNDMLEELEGAIRDIHLSVNRLREVKKQLKLKVELLEDQENSDSLIASGEKALKAIDSWERKLIQPRQKTFQDVINYENRLSAEFNMLRSKVDSFDPRLTEGVKERSGELLDEWETLKSEMKGIINKEIGTFNARYRESDLPALIVPDTGN
jgi:hypothetical protein